METHQAAAGGDEQQICRRNSVKYGQCKNVSGDNPYRFCDFHYIILTDFLTNGTSFINSKSIEPPTKKKKEIQKKNNMEMDKMTIEMYMKKKEIQKKNKMEMDKKKMEMEIQKKNRMEIQRKNRMEMDKKKMEMEIQKMNRMEIQRKNRMEMDKKKMEMEIEKKNRMEMAKKTIEMYKKKKEIQKKNKMEMDKKKMEMEIQKKKNRMEMDKKKIDMYKKKKEIQKKNKMEMDKKTIERDIQNKDENLPPDEQRCRHTSGKACRCKNFRMGHGDNSLPKGTYCEKHYNYYINYRKNHKRRSGDGAGSSAATRPIQETRVPKRRKKVSEEEDDCSLEIQPPTSNTIVGGGSPNIGSGELESLTGIRENVIELESLEHYKSKRFELPVDLEKRKPECTKFKVKFVEVEETRKTGAKVEPEEWNKCSDLETPTLRVENENSTRRCMNSNLERLVPRNGKRSSALRCVELHNFEKIESVAWGLQNEVTQAGEKHNTSKPNAETSSGVPGGTKDSHVFELKNQENVHGIDINKAVKIHSDSLHLSSWGEKVEEGEGWGCSEGRLSQHGPSSEDHLEMSTKAFVNLVSDDSGECLDESEDSDSSGSPGTLMDMMAMKYRNRKEGKEMKWKFEADMLSSLQEEPDLCMKAVCALYRQHISKDGMSANGLFHYSDLHRGTFLAKFLMDEACKGELKKSVKELEIFDSKGVKDCKRLATRYSKQLFSIYQSRKDPYFLPATTASHGDQIFK